MFNISRHKMDVKWQKLNLKYWYTNMKERGHLEEAGIDGRHH